VRRHCRRISISGLVCGDSFSTASSAAVIGIVIVVGIVSRRLQGVAEQRGEGWERLADVAANGLWNCPDLVDSGLV